MLRWRKAHSMLTPKTVWLQCLQDTKAALKTTLVEESFIRVAKNFSFPHPRTFRGCFNILISVSVIDDETTTAVNRTLLLLI